jgi:hypothetical protein
MPFGSNRDGLHNLRMYELCSSAWQQARRKCGQVFEKDFGPAAMDQRGGRLVYGERGDYSRCCIRLSDSNGLSVKRGTDFGFATFREQMRILLRCMGATVGCLCYIGELL